MSNTGAIYLLLWQANNPAAPERNQVIGYLRPVSGVISAIANLVGCLYHCQFQLLHQ